MAELEPMDERMVTHSSDEEDNNREESDEMSQKIALFQVERSCNVYLILYG